MRIRPNVSSEEASATVQGICLRRNTTLEKDKTANVAAEKWPGCAFPAGTVAWRAEEAGRGSAQTDGVTGHLDLEGRNENKETEEAYRREREREKRRRV